MCFKMCSGSGDTFPMRVFHLSGYNNNNNLGHAMWRLIRIQEGPMRIHIRYVSNTDMAPIQVCLYFIEWNLEPYKKPTNHVSLSAKYVYAYHCFCVLQNVQNFRLVFDVIIGYCPIGQANDLYLCIRDLRLMVHIDLSLHRGWISLNVWTFFKSDQVSHMLS